MPDLGLRNLGLIIPGAKNAEPTAGGDAPRGALRNEPSRQDGAHVGAPVPDARGAERLVRPAAPLGAAPAPAAPPTQSGAPLFASDFADARAAQGGLDSADAALALLAELALHKGTQTPFSIGLIGPSGSGKSVALGKLVGAVEALAATSKAGLSPAFIGDALVLRIDADDLDGPAATALAGALYARLVLDAPQLAQEASHAARDPGAAAREAFDRLDAASRKLQSERGLLEEAEARRARLTDAVLYETPGSKVDDHAARRRGRIIAAMTRFGVPGDPMLGYKDMVRTLADARGPARLGFIARAFWGLKGQASPIVWAIVLALAALGLDAALAHQATWLAWLRAQPQMIDAANWIGAHLDWLVMARGAAYAGAGLALFVNLWRGVRLLQLVFRGERLLELDLVERRRECDAFIGRQARRVQDLTSDVERLGRKAAEAERRAGGLNLASPASAEPSPFAVDLLKQQAQRFIAAVGAQVESRAPEPCAALPQRIILALDNLDRTPPARAREILGAASGAGLVSLIAVDPSGFGEPGAALDRWIAAPFSVAELGRRRDSAASLRALIGAGAEPRSAEAAERAPLDDPLSESETRLLAALAPVADISARALKRFANLYRLLRSRWPDRPDRRAALALVLALDAAPAKDDLAALEVAVMGPDSEPIFDHHKISARLALALQALAAEKVRFDKEDLRAAIAFARLFSFRS